jgi:hypothetical protein
VRSRSYIFVLLAFAIAALSSGCFGGGDDKGTSANVQPQLLEASQSKLTKLAGEQGHEVYWAGPKSGTRYEWTRTADNRLFVRYLQGNTKIGDRNKAFLTIATYSFPNAKNALQALGAKSPGAQTTTVGNAFVFYSKAAPSSAYVAFPGSDYEVEVFDPAPGKAFTIAKSGDIQPIK